MNRFARATRLAACAAALPLLAGCAAPREAPDWNFVSVQDQHRFLPTLLQDQMRPAVVVTAGPTGLVVGTGSVPPAAHVLAQDGQLRLVSQDTYARLQQSPGGTSMGGSPAAPAPAAEPGAAPSR